MAALITRFKEHHTEYNTTSHLRAPFLIRGQRTFTKFNSSTGEIPFFSLITNIYPTIKLSIKLSFDWVHNLKPNWKTHLNLNRTQNSNSSSTHLGILQTHLQYLVMKKSPLFFLGKAALKYHINHIYFKWRGSLFLPYQTFNGNCTPIHGYCTKEYMGVWIGRV